MDDRPYYYRLRGRTFGPMGLLKIRKLVQRAQVGRATEVSRDGQQWDKADAWPEIFDADGAGSEAPVAGPEVATSNWYYAVNGMQQGPVDLGTLRGMIAAGQLTPSDHVFPEGGTDWLPIGSVPQLAGAGGAAPGAAQGPTHSPGSVINITNPPPQPDPPGGANGMAIAGFVLGILGLLGSWCILGIPLWLLAIIFSGVALAGKNRSQRGLGIAGLVMGITAAGIMVIVMILGVANYIFTMNNF